MSAKLNLRVNPAQRPSFDERLAKARYANNTEALKRLDQEAVDRWAKKAGLSPEPKPRGNVQLRTNSRKCVANSMRGVTCSCSSCQGRGNERGDDNDRRQIIADLLSNDASPYTPDDEAGLRMMSDATLVKMRDQYAPRANAVQVFHGNIEEGIDAACRSDPAIAAMLSTPQARWSAANEARTGRAKVTGAAASVTRERAVISANAADDLGIKAMGAGEERRKEIISTIAKRRGDH